MLTVKQLMEQLEEMPEDLPVYVYDTSCGDAYPIDLVDTLLSVRVDININIDQHKAEL
jgi:hypothetical protein